MSDEKREIGLKADTFNGEPLTAREVGIARWAYVRARSRFSIFTCDTASLRREAELEHPMPMVERPRVVRLSETSYRVNYGHLEHREDGTAWMVWLRPAEVDLLRALFNDPTERVPADE